MKSKFMADAKSLFFCIALVTLFPLAQKTARADNVTFSTSGTFSNGLSSISFGSGGNTLTLTFIPASATLNTDTNASFGEVRAQATGSGAAIGPGIQLTITITQTAPSGGTAVFIGNLNTGLITPTSSLATLTFPAGQVGPVSIGSFVYRIANPNPLALVAPNTGESPQGRTSIQGSIVTLVPEPTSMVLFATGLSGIVSLRRRWAKRH